MNSLDIAKKYKKQHQNVLKAIRRMLERNPELETHFTMSFYYDKKHEKRPMYLLDDSGKTIMENKFKFNIRNARFEYKMLNELCDFFDELHIEYIKQYPILTYRVDLFLPYYNLCIEYDENEHKFKEEYDKDREDNIKENIGCEFVRIKEDESVGVAIGRIFKKIGGGTFSARKVV